jgi:hypothetical protein
MYRMIRRVLCALSFSAIVVGLAQVASGESFARFGASYRLTNIVESGNQVDLTIKITLLNPSNSDVKGGIVVFYSSLPGRSLLGSFTAIKSLPHMGQTTVSQSFSISAAEYARWQEGHEPIFEFLVPGSDGASAASIQSHRVLSPGESIN